MAENLPERAPDQKKDLPLHRRVGDVWGFRWLTAKDGLNEPLSGLGLHIHAETLSHFNLINT